MSVPKLTFEQAEGIGTALFDQLVRLAEPRPLPFARDNLVWADMVQLVLWRAAEVQADAAARAEFVGDAAQQPEAERPRAAGAACLPMSEDKGPDGPAKGDN